MCTLGKPRTLTSHDCMPSAEPIFNSRITSIEKTKHFSRDTKSISSMSPFALRWLLPLLAGLCVIDGSISPSQAATTNITVGDNFFSPNNVTINVNDTVQWVWSMSEVNPHSTTSTSAPSLWDSGVATEPFMFSHTFPSAGDFPFVCTVHPFMTGRVTVNAANAPPTVAITAPANDATFPAPWTGTINVTASDVDDTVSRVRFFAGVTLLGTVTNPPVNLSLRVTNLAAGNYVLTAVATDSRGASTTSAGVTIHIVTPSAVIGLLGNMAFGSLPAGETATRTLVITNRGTLPLNVSGITYSPAFSGDWSGSIAPHNSHQVLVTFSPTDQASYGGTVVVTSDAASGLGSLQISGTAYFPITNAWTIWWQNTGGTLALWSMSGTNAEQKPVLTPPSSGSTWRVAGTTDFNGDGQTDLLFESTAGGVAAWLMNGSNRQTNSYLTPRSTDPSWQARGIGDLNGDGGHDILWQRADGYLATWLMNGLVATQTARLNPLWVDPSWKIAGIADFDGDTKSDILFRNTDGRIAVWFMNGVNRSSAGYLNPKTVDPSWRLAAIVDFNADGHPGLLWEHTSGALAYWQMAGTNMVHAGRLTPAMVDPAWQIAGQGR
jgi:plastocyanin